MNMEIIDEMCHASFSSIKPKYPQHELLGPSLVIEDLRSRLSRRNALLDTVRKAYHRDVIAIKEHLIDLTSRGILPSSDDAERGHSLQSFLSSVPSLDLRPTLQLFAPQECELKNHPCYLCGGQLEIIHRESTRIVQYKQAIALLEEKEQELRCQMIDARVEADGDRTRKLEVMEKARQEREVLLDQILALKYQVADRDALEEELKQTKLQKGQLEEKIERQRPILLDHERLVVDIERVRQERDDMTYQFHTQVKANETLQSEKDELTQQLSNTIQQNQSLHQQLASSKEQCQHLQDTCSALTLDLSKSKDATTEAESCLHKAEEAIYELEFDLEQEKERAGATIQELESRCTNLTKSVSSLEEKVQEHAEEAASYRKRIDATLEGARRRGSIMSVPRSGDAAFAKTDELVRDMENYRNKAATLSNLLLSCIRSTYENCLVQENMLRGNGSGLHNNKKMLNMPALTTNEKAGMVLERLNDAQDSDTIEWAISLADETDQRHALGNLQNRLQMGQFSLNKCFEKIHKDAASELQRCQDGHKKQTNEKVNRIWELEKLLTDAIAVNRRYEGIMRFIRDKHEHSEQMLDAMRSALRKLRKDCNGNKDTTTKLHNDFCRLRSATETLLHELRTARQKIQVLNATVGEQREDIDARDTAMQQLEKLLENITHRYAENERLRIKVTNDAAVQAAAKTTEVCCVADFLPTPLRTVASEDDNKSKSSADVLLPGRIIQLQNDENWPLANHPSRINVRPPSGQVQYRRAIDRL